jgi:hypothetical protein
VEARELEGKPTGSPTTGRSRTFRLFVSSTFQDLRAERNALHAHVFPRLRELCRRHDCRFQAIDLRWGVSGEAALDQQTMTICLREIERCHDVTPRPNFLVLLGDRYGWRPPPPRIPASEFDALLKHVSEEEAELLRWTDEQPVDGKGWYRRDENANPTEYRLRPRQRHKEEAARQDEAAEWGKIEARLQSALERAAEKASLPGDGDARLKYKASATAQEIAFGALQVEHPEEKVFCFFRTIEGAKDNDGNLLDGAETFIDPDPAPLDALKAELRKKLKRRPEALREYTAQWTGGGPATDHIGTLPEALGECLALFDANEPPRTLCASVWRQLGRTILREIEHPTVLPAAPDEKIHVPPDDGLDAEGLAHCDFANRLLRFFVGRVTPLRDIHDYLAGEGGRPLAVVAAGGAGKSALMAKALEEAKGAHPKAQIVYRFIGATPSSSDGRSLLVSLCREISRRYGGGEEVPYDYTELVPELEKRMGSATADRPLIIVLDALDQLSEAHGARSLTWLPRRLPERVRVVVSTRTDAETFPAVKRLQPKEVELDKMSREEGEELLRLWLDDAGRKLTDGQKKKVLDAFEAERSAGRPLYLKLAFEEARLWPSYVPAKDLEDLEPGIDGVIRRNLFQRLAREENHGRELVARAVGYLAVSRYGLAEDELLDVLSRDADLYTTFLRGSYHLPSDLVTRAIAHRRARSVEGGREGDEAQRAEAWLRALITNPNDTSGLRGFLDEILPARDGPRLPVVLWSRLLHDLAPYLTTRLSDGASLLTFYHRELTDVGAQEYARAERGQELHSRLADYFRFRADPEHDGSWTGEDVRGLSELPYHLTEAARWDDVHDTLTDFRFLEHKAAEVGVEAPGGDGQGETVYTGVFQLQQDFDHVLQRIPGGGGAAGGRRPLIVTAVDFGKGHVVRCPWCNTTHAVSEERRRDWLGQEITCPNKECGGPLKVNPFVVDRAQGRGK